MFDQKKKTPSFIILYACAVWTPFRGISQYTYTRLIKYSKTFLFSRHRFNSKVSLYTTGTICFTAQWVYLYRVYYNNTVKFNNMLKRSIIFQANEIIKFLIFFLSTNVLFFNYKKQSNDDMRAKYVGTV